MIHIENLSEVFYRKDLLTGNTIGPMKKDVFLAKIKEEIKKDQVSYWFNMEKINCCPSNKWNYSGIDPIIKDTNGYQDFYRHYIVYLDGYERIIDPRCYMKEALASNGEDFYNKYYSYHRNRYNSYEYRNGPVPYIKKRRGGCPCSKKCKGIKRIFKYCTDTEYGDYVRNKAIPFKFGDWWDVYVPYRSHESWKNHKKRKQWM